MNKFKSNNRSGGTDFSDLPMELKKLGFYANFVLSWDLFIRVLEKEISVEWDTNSFSTSDLIALQHPDNFRIQKL